MDTEPDSVVMSGACRASRCCLDFDQLSAGCRTHHRWSTFEPFGFATVVAFRRFNSFGVPFPISCRLRSFFESVTGGRNHRLHPPSHPIILGFNHRFFIWLIFHLRDVLFPLFFDGRSSEQQRLPRNLRPQSGHLSRLLLRLP